MASWVNIKMTRFLWPLCYVSMPKDSLLYPWDLNPTETMAGLKSCTGTLSRAKM